MCTGVSSRLQYEIHCKQHIAFFLSYTACCCATFCSCRALQRDVTVSLLDLSKHQSSEVALTSQKSGLPYRGVRAQVKINYP